MYSMTGGNEYNRVGLLEHAGPFAVYKGPGWVGEGPIVPVSSLRAYLDQELAASIERITQLTKATSAHVVHIAAPPPHPNSDYIRHHTEINLVRRGLDRLKINPAPLRLRLWEMQNNCLRSALDPLGVEFLPPPAQGVTTEGYLAKAFFADNATHANAQYGALLLGHRFASEIKRVVGLCWRETQRKGWFDN